MVGKIIQNVTPHSPREGLWGKGHVAGAAFLEHHRIVDHGKGFRAGDGGLDGEVKADDEEKTGHGGTRILRALM